MVTQTEHNQMVKQAKEPPHYQGKKFQLWDVIIDFDLSFFEANIVKYVTRWKKKNGLADLYKAREYLNKLIEAEESKTLFIEDGEETPESIDG